MFTRADLEEELIEELGPYAAISKLDAATHDGSNKSFEGPIRRAVLATGGTVADAPRVDDADIGTSTGSFDRISYFARYYLLDKVWGNWPHVDQTKGTTSQHLDQLAKRIRERIAEIKEELKDPDLIEETTVEGSPEAGVIEAGSEWVYLG